MKTIWILLATVVIFNASAQTGGRSLVLHGVYDKGIIKLRWATGSPVVWDLLRTNGLKLTRQESRDSIAETLNNGIQIRVLNEEQWKAKAKEIPAAAQIATLLRDNEKERAQLTDYGQADLERNKLKALLLMAEFNFDIAEGLALAWADSSIQAKKIYRYIITLPDPVHKDTLKAECFVNTTEETPLVFVTGLKGETGDGYIDLWWNRMSFHSGYFIERRAVDEKEWRRLNVAPKIYADNYKNKYLFRDSVANGKWYEYRVRGTDSYCRISEPSSSLKLQSRDLTPPKPPYDVQWKKKDNGVQITWKNPSKEADLAGYAVLRSQNPDDNYKPIHQELLKPITTSYFDVVLKTGTYFYRLISSDTAGNLSSMSVRAMAVIDDTIPAPAPIGLTAKADTNGVITVRWRHRMEDDVAGYRLYRMIAGGKKPEFVPITPGAVIDTVFTDTLMASVRDRFVYRVRSVDFAGNYSEPSAQVAVQFPDVTPPVAPIIQNYSVKDKKVRLNFISPSADVAQYEVHRTILPAQKRDVSLKTSKNEWTDSTAQHGTEYQYDVSAIDSTGNISESSRKLTVKPYWKVELKNPPAPSVSFDKSAKSVTIRWNYPEKNGYTAIVFKKTGDGKFQQLSPLLMTDSYINQNVMSGKYEYALRFYYKEQGGTTMGPAAMIIVP